MNIALNKAATFTAFLFVVASSITFAQNKPPREKEKEVRLFCEVPIKSSYGLISTLTQAVQSDKTSPSFRVIWADTSLGGTNNGTCVYNRKKGTLRYYDLNGYIYDVGWRPQLRTYYVFTKVTDEKLIKVAQFSDSVKLRADVLPELLLRVGCRKNVDRIREFKAPVEKRVYR